MTPGPLDLDRLRVLATAATPGPYEWDEKQLCVYAPDGRIMFDRSVDCDDSDRADAAYIAAVSPDVLLALLSRLQASEARDETGWLIEQNEGRTLYWGFDGFNVWVTSPEHAVRFARRQDAEMAAHLLGSEGRHQIVEHRWSTPTPCPSCGGAGQEVIGEHHVTRDMATDAGEPGMEGMFHSYEYGPCEACDGTGIVAQNESKS